MIRYRIDQQMYLSLRYDDRLLSLGLPVVSRLPVGRLPVSLLPVSRLSISLLSVWIAVTWGLLGLLGDDYCGSVVIVPVVHGIHGGLLLELFCLSFAVAVADEGDDDDGSDDGTDNCSTDGSDAGTAAVVVPAGVVVGGGVVGVVFWAVSIVVAAIVVAIVAVADHVWSEKQLQKMLDLISFTLSTQQNQSYTLTSPLRLAPPSAPANLLLEPHLPNYLPVFASSPCALLKSKPQNSTNSLVQIKGYFHQHMGNCCYADDNVDYGMLAPQQQPPRETKEYRREAHPDSYPNPKQTSNLPPQPPNRPSGAAGDSERQSYFRKTSSINESAPHLRQYHHVHIVKPPSYLQSSGQMALFQDGNNLGRLMNPNLAIRTSNPPYKPSLEGIREQQMTYI